MAEEKSSHASSQFSANHLASDWELELSPDRNRGSASPCPASPWPSSPPPGISSPAAPKHASAPLPTGGRWSRGGRPVSSWHEPLLPCPGKFWVSPARYAQSRIASRYRSSSPPRNRGRSRQNWIPISPHAHHTAIHVSAA